jgi:hypothetical protein
VRVAWAVVIHPLASAELAKIPAREQVAVRNAVTKLREGGPVLPFPHSSAVANADRLRELRPRAGRCPWRAFYRQVGAVFVVAAVGPEAQVKPREFVRAVSAAEQRLKELEEEDR